MNQAYSLIFLFLLGPVMSYAQTPTVTATPTGTATSSNTNDDSWRPLSNSGIGSEERFLNDNQANEAANYHHDEYMANELKSACEKAKAAKKLKDDPCAGNVDSSGKVFGGSGDQIVEAAAKMYAGIFGMASNKFKMTYKYDPKLDSKKKNQFFRDEIKAEQEACQANATTPACTEARASLAQSKKTTEQTDYCSFLPMVTEVAATGYQTVMQQGIEQTTQENMSKGDMQKEALYAMARSHDARADSAKIQMIGWGATSGCYAVTMVGWASTPGLANPPGQWALLSLKTAGAAFFTTYYALKRSKHQKYAEAIRDIAKKLPGDGACNPYTDTQCYCSQESTKNDPKFCLPRNLASRNNPANATVCVDDMLKEDKECKCQKSNSCFDVKFKGLAGSDINLGMNFMNSGFKDLGSVTSGQFPTGNFLNGAQGSASMANRAVKKFADKLPGDIRKMNLNGDQSKLMNTFLSQGVPAEIAPLMAHTSSNAPASAVGSFTKGQGLISNYSPRNRESMESTANYGNTDTDGPSRKKTNESDLNPFNKGKAGANNDKILEFAADKATNDADIHRAPEKNIFDILSHRYRSSTWNKFQVEGTANP